IADQDLRAACLVREALAGASPLADAVFALQALGTVPILLAGARELKDRWLPAVLAGRAMASFAMTEPEAGSDVSAIAPTGAPGHGGGGRVRHGGAGVAGGGGARHPAPTVRTHAQRVPADPGEARADGDGPHRRPPPDLPRGLGERPRR